MIRARIGFLGFEKFVTSVLLSTGYAASLRTSIDHTTAHGEVSRPNITERPSSNLTMRRSTRAATTMDTIQPMNASHAGFDHLRVFYPKFNNRLVL